MICQYALKINAIKIRLVTIQGVPHKMKLFSLEPVEILTLTSFYFKRERGANLLMNKKIFRRTR